MKKIAIIGLGALGTKHLTNLAKMEGEGKVSICAICDIDEKKLEGAKVQFNLGTADAGIDYGKYKKYTDYKKMLQNEVLDAVFVVTPTFLHKEMSVAALLSGCDVFCEKPMALDEKECEEMVFAAEESGKNLQIGQCLRYWGEYEYLKDVYENGTYGKLLSASFIRLSPVPWWCEDNWFLEYEKSGGALLDLHVHDIDFIQYAFGMPKMVSSAAVLCEEKGRWPSVETRYIYENNMQISAVGSWIYNKGFPFRMEYLAQFELASVIYEKGKLLVFDNNGTQIEPTYQKADAYVTEIEKFIDCCEKGIKNEKVSPRSTMLSIKIARGEEQSIIQQKPIEL